MAFGLTSTRDDRRRRVLTEELITAPRAAAGGTVASADDPSAADGASPGSRYTSAAAYDNQSRVTDVIPRWRITIVVLWLLAAALITGLLVLHVRQSRLAALVGQTWLAPLDLARLRGATAGSLAVWFASVLLALASVVSVLVYSVRRHRNDDYHGRYRIWLWTAPVWLFLSLNTTSGLHSPAVEAMKYWTGWSALADGAIWWLVPVAVLVATMGIRLLADVRECRIAFTALATAYGCWTASIVIHLGLLPVVGDPIATTAVAGTVLGGHVMLLTGLVLYARHVVLDAEGLLPQRQRKPRQQKKETAPESTKRRTLRRVGRKTAAAKSPRERPAQQPAPVGSNGPYSASSAAGRRTDLESDSKTAPSGRQPKITAWTDGSDGSDEPCDEDDRSRQPVRRLSKAERKRLRKLKQKQRQNRAA